jgi:putative transposase
VFTPKYRKKALFGQIRRHLGTVLRELARRKECQIEEGHLLPDHVHPKYSVAEVIGYLKGKSSIWIAQKVERKVRQRAWGEACRFIALGRRLPRIHPFPAAEGNHTSYRIARGVVASGNPRCSVGTVLWLTRSPAGTDTCALASIPEPACD